MSNTLNDKEFTEAMKNQQKISGMLDKESFWREFKDKSKGIDQDSEVKQPILFMSRWAKVAACFIVVFCLFFGLFIFNGAEPEVEVTAVIEDYEIYADHSGVLILEDEDESGTILWVTGMNESNTGELL